MGGVKRVLVLCLVLLALPAAVAFAHPEPGDADGDGFGDTVDNCPQVRNDQRDADGDGFGDKCDDDADNDGVANNAPDNCPLAFNPDQADTGGRPGVGDACDKDTDGDGRDDIDDNCPTDPNPGWFDNDMDGYGDVCDPDDDDDGDHDVRDNCPLVYNWDQVDQDGDGRGAACDADDAAASTGPGTGGPGAGADKTRPKVAMVVARRLRLRTVEAGLVVRVHCSEACAATATLVADKRTARKLGLPASRIAARDAAQVSSAAATYAFLRFPKAVKRRVWSRPLTRLTLHVEAVDRAGNRREVTRRLTLLR
jgi:hypothetical protein